MNLDQRLQTERNIWLATVRPDGSPHLTPTWFVWVEGRAYVCTLESNIKTRNVRANPHIMFSLESGDAPAVAEAMVDVLQRPYPRSVVDAFAAKFEWDITKPDDEGPYDALWKISVNRWLMGGSPPG